MDRNLEKDPIRGNATFVDRYIKRCFRKVGCKTKFSKKRTVETFIAYKKSADSLSDATKKLIATLPIGLQKELGRREKMLDTFIWKPKSKTL